MSTPQPRALHRREPRNKGFREAQTGKHPGFISLVFWLTDVSNGPGTSLPQLCDAASGLAHLHSLNPLIAHGNLKPENVVVKDNIQAALCDLEVSRMFVGIGGASELTTMDGMTRGTPGYQAKELLQDNAPPASGPGDVYALGGLILAVRSSLRFSVRVVDGFLP